MADCTVKTSDDIRNVRPLHVTIIWFHLCRVTDLCVFVCLCYCDAGRHSAAANRRRPQSSRDLLSGLHPRLWRAFALQHHINRGWGGKSPSNSQSQRGERDKSRGKVSDKVHMAHSTHNTHCETSQVPNVVNPNCRFNGKGAPKVSFSKRKTTTGIYGEFGRQMWQQDEWFNHFQPCLCIIKSSG